MKLELGYVNIHDIQFADQSKVEGGVLYVNQDDVKNLETQIQKLTDKFVAEIDKLAEAKEKEILSI